MIVLGNVDGLKKGTLYLHKKDSLVVNLDSVYLKGGGNYKLITNIKNLTSIIYTLDKEDGDSLNDIIAFFGNKGEIEINTRLSTFDSSYEIKGSKNSDLRKNTIL